MSLVTLIPNQLLADPEAVAMLQAFYSRSSDYVSSRIDGLDVAAVKQSLNKYYINYGHDSIGDTANTVVFFEDVSLLCAKALEDNPLFNGQETSTRFISFNNSQMYKPDIYSSTNNAIIEELQDVWMSFYTDNLDQVRQALSEKYPFEAYPHLDNTTWLNSISARAFDIMRGVLPAGCLTKLSYSASLRTLRDALSNLQLHPMVEVSGVARDALAQLKLQYPFAFSKDKYTVDQERFLEEMAPELFYSVASLELLAHSYYKSELGHTTPLQLTQYLCKPMYESYNVDYHLASLKWKKAQQTNECIITGGTSIPNIAFKVLEQRLKGIKVPYNFGAFGRFSVSFMLDYGSFRDIQRHRNNRTPMPILTTDFGMHPWYVEQLKQLGLGDKLATTFIAATGVYDHFRSQYFTDHLALQYAIPLAYQVPVEMDITLDQMFYLAELRTSKSVHPTLRHVAKQLGSFLESLLQKINPLDVPYLNLDLSEDAFCEWRGKQTILPK